MLEMKDSGIAWLGNIPTHWEVIYPKALFRLRKEKAKPGDRQLTASQQYGVIYQDEYMALTGSRVVTVEKDFDILKRVEKGDFVISMRSFQGGLEYSENAGSISSAYVMLVPNLEYVVPEFYKWALKSPTYITALQCTSNLIRDGQAMRYSNFVQVPLCVIPREEQKAIADILNKECGKIDALIINQQAQIEKLKAYKQSLITEVVTKGLDPTAPMKDSGVDVYPSVPEHWNVQKTLTTLTMPITDGPHTTPELLPEGIPFVSAEAVSCGNGSIDFDHIRGFISQEFYDECSKKYVPQKNDIYMIKSGATTGRVSVVDTDRIFTIWSPLAVFRCNSDVVHFRFLYYFLQSTAYQRQVQFGWTYGTQQNIGMRTLERLKVFVPPLDEQYAIAECLDAKCIQVDRLISIKQAKIEKLEQYKHSLIYEYVTGKREVV